MQLRSAIPAIFFAAIAVAQQQIVLPDSQYLCEDANQLFSVGGTVWFTNTTSSRFQLLYEPAAFTGVNGVTGPIVITKVRFRGEDAERNSGGQVYNNVAIALGSTTMNTATLTSAFATNLASGTTTMGPTGTTNITVLPSQGSLPNNWIIEFDLQALGASIVYDPTSGQSLLIDVTVPSAPIGAAPLAMIPLQNAANTVPTTVTHAKGVYANSATATAGTLTGTGSTLSPALVGLEFVGPGGFTQIVPARNEFYGAACGGQASSFYQAFLNGQPFDLGAGLTMLPDNPVAPNYYIVSSGAPAPDTTKVNAAPQLTADDGLFTYALGFTFNYPGGSTTNVVPSSNGFVWLDPVMTDNAFAAVVSRLLGDGVPPYTSPSQTWAGARLAILWKDLNLQRNVGLNPAAGLHGFTDTSAGPGNAVAYITWWNVGEFNQVGGTGLQLNHGHTDWTFQMVFYEATGAVEFRYGNVPTWCTSSTSTLGSHATIVGFSRGRIGGANGVNSVDPQNRDISQEGVFLTAVEGAVGNVGLRAIASPNAGGSQYGGRMYAGQTLTWNAINVPAGTLLGATLLDVTASRPGFQFPTITAPGCILSTSTNALLWETFLLPSATAVGAVPFVVPSGILGVDIYAQFVALDGLFGGANLITLSSHAIQHTVGLN